VVSAGFIDEFMECYGESISVNRKSRKDIDTLMLQTMLSIDDKKIEYDELNVHYPDIYK